MNMTLVVLTNKPMALEVNWKAVKECTLSDGTQPHTDDRTLQSLANQTQIKSVPPPQKKKKKKKKKHAWNLIGVFGMGKIVPRATKKNYKL